MAWPEQYTSQFAPQFDTILTANPNSITNFNIDNEFNNLLTMRDAIDNPNSINNIRTFCIDYKKIKDSIKLLCQQIDEAEELKLKYEKVLENTYILNLDEELTDKIKKQTDAKITELKLDILYEQHNKHRKYCETAKFLIDIIKIELGPNTEDVNLCPICMDNYITNVISPCGHCVCKKCKENIKYTCFICRARVNNLIKIYYN